jgi:hypothetical protein
VMSQLPQCAVSPSESLQPASGSSEQRPKPGRHEPSLYTQTPSLQPIASGTTFGSAVQSWPQEPQFLSSASEPQPSLTMLADMSREPLVGCVPLEAFGGSSPPEPGITAFEAPGPRAPTPDADSSLQPAPAHVAPMSTMATAPRPRQSATDLRAIDASLAWHPRHVECHIESLLA